MCWPRTVAWDDALLLPTQTLHHAVTCTGHWLDIHCTVLKAGVGCRYFTPDFKSIHNYMVDSWGGWVSKLSTSSKLRNGNIGSFGGGEPILSMKYKLVCCTKWLPIHIQLQRVSKFHSFPQHYNSLCWLLYVAHIYIFTCVENNETAQTQPLRGPHCVNLNLLDALIFSLCFQAFKVPSPRITSALSVPEGTPSREEGHLELLDLRIHSKRYSESFICRQ